MQRKIFYYCDICGRHWDDIDDAAKCEARGPGKEYPIGCIYGDHRNVSMYENITFAVAINRVEVGTMLGHMNNGSSWACRDTSAGDTLGENMCGGSSLYLSKSHKNVDPSTSHFIRMMQYLRNNRIEITVWDGEKPVTYATFLKRFKEGIWYKENNSLHKEDLLT